MYAAATYQAEQNIANAYKCKLTPVTRNLYI